MKIVSLLLSVLFMTFAALQLNDEDPILWVLIYGYIAAVPVLYLYKVYPTRLVLATIVAGLIFSAFYIPGLVEWIRYGSPDELAREMKATKPYIEESREFIGLFLGMLVLLFYYLKEKQLLSARR